MGSFREEMYFTLDEMWVIGLMRRQNSGHLVVVGRVYIFINTVPSQLYLLRITQVINLYYYRYFFLSAKAPFIKLINVIAQKDLR